MIYIGTDTRYQVALLTGDKLFVRVQNLGQYEDETLGRGDMVTVSWSSDHAQVLAE